MTSYRQLLERLKQRSKSDDAFMGVTHATSALMAALLIIAFAPGFFELVMNFGTSGQYAKMSGIPLIALVALFVGTWAGASMIPDLDNTQSRAMNDLGLFGKAISIIFRGSSTFIQHTIRSPRDDPEPDPHRGFWHTFVSCILLGGLIFWATTVPAKLTLPLVGETTWGVILAFFFSFIAIHLMMSSLAKKFMDKVRRKAVAGEVVAFVISAAVTLSCFALIPSRMGYMWVGIAYAGGAACHIIGDAFTKKGTPMFFPLTVLKRQKKMWWNTRFAKITTGGPAEQLLTIVFTIGSIIGIGWIIIQAFM